MTDERDSTGRRIRREVLGDAHVDAATTATSAFTAPFQAFITRTAWGDVWARPGLDRRTRSAITLAILTALRAEGEIGIHVRGALRNGLTADEIAEVLLHAAVYAGVPAANSAFAIAQRIVAEEDTTARRTVGRTEAKRGATDSSPPPATGRTPTTPTARTTSPAIRRRRPK